MKFKPRTTGWEAWMLPLSHAIYPKVFTHLTFFALASILSVHLKRNSAYSYIAFVNIPGMDALANPSVLVTQATRHSCPFTGCANYYCIQLWRPLPTKCLRSYFVPCASLSNFMKERNRFSTDNQILSFLHQRKIFTSAFSLGKIAQEIDCNEIG